MAVEYLILPNIDVVYVRYRGTVTTSQIGMAYSAYLEDSDFVPGRREFADLHQVHQFDINFAEVNKHFDLLIQSYESGDSVTTTAIFAPSPEGAKLARIYEALSAGVSFLNVSVFGDREAAARFLGLPVNAEQLMSLVDDISRYYDEQ